MLFSGTYSFWLVWSTSTAWRWLKVPRWQSSPDSRTRWPSSSSVPNASASPVAQSMPWPLSIIARLASSWRAILGLTSKPSGTRASARPTWRSASGSTAVLPSVHSALGVGRGQAGPAAFQPVRLVRLVRLRRLVGVLQRGGEAVPHAPCGLRRSTTPSATELLGIQRAGGLAVADGAIHDRLGEGRLVGFVMAVAAVADDVEHDVAAELSCGTRRPSGRTTPPPRGRRR